MTEAPEIIMYGTTWCGQTRRARALLDRNNIPYRWIDIDIELDALENPSAFPMVFKD